MTPTTSTLFSAAACSLLLAQSGLALDSRGSAGALQNRHLAEEAGSSWTYRSTGTHEEEPYGPSDWYMGYPDCALDEQSPINIAADVETVVKASEFDMAFYSHECASDELAFQSDAHTWKVTFNGCAESPYLEFDGDTYNLAQIHIHSPSEHMIGGSEHDAEIHFVHIREGSDADLLVVGVMFDANEFGQNIEIQNLWDVLDIGEETTDEEFVVKVYDMLPANPVYSHYMGSLTTPPCTEGVKWIVMTEPNTMSKTQLDEFRTFVALFDDSKVSETSSTNRPVQDLNDREVYFVAA